MRILILLSTLFLAASAVDYTGHKVLRVTPTNDDQLDFLRHLQSGPIDYWRGPESLNRPAEFRVSPAEFERTVSTLTMLGFTHEIAFSDVGKLVEHERRQIALRRDFMSGKVSFDFANYHPLNEINGLIDQLMSEYPNLVSKESIGTSLEGREISMATISTGQDPNRPVIFFDCGIHAREWISPATCVWIMNELVTKYGSDPVITNYVDTFDWKFIPVLNVDGYEWTWSNDRLWRKNRNRDDPICTGVDLNRNFLVGFGGPGSSGSPCSDTYRGRSAFSELESQSVRDAVANLRGRIVAALSIHSYSQLWMAPYSYVTNLPADFAEQNRVAGIAVAALTATYGTSYRYGSSANVLYVASGATGDYYYDVEGIVYSYIIELRDTGNWGFTLPPDQILPTAMETWNGLKAMTDEIINSLEAR